MFNSNPYENIFIGFDIDNYHNIREQILSNTDFPNTKLSSEFDLRTPQNQEIKLEIFKAFGLDGNMNYPDNLKLINTTSSISIIVKKLKGVISKTNKK